MFFLPFLFLQIDWTRPLTPPATNRHLKSNTTTTTTTNNNNTATATAPKTGSNVTAAAVAAAAAIIKKNHPVSDVDNKIATTATIATQTAIDAADPIAQHHHQIAAAAAATTPTATHTDDLDTENLAPNYANNNDLAPTNVTTTDAADETAVQSLSLRLQNELRRAKSQHLACTEVLLPSDLLNRIASKMIAMSEKEPCGIRGSIIYIEFEDEPNNTRYVYSIRFVSSFHAF